MSNRSKSRRRGTIAPKGEGKWLVRVSLGRDPATGQWMRLNKLIRGTRREAEQWLTETMGKHDKGVPVPRSRLTLEEWLTEFDTVWSGHLAPTTRAKYRESLECYLPGWLRGTRLASLRSETFQALYNELSATKAPATVKYFHRVLSARLTKAVQRGHLVQNPLAAVELPAPEHREYRVFTAGEARVFLELAASDRFGALWTVLLLTGMRPEEALGLKWEDFDGESLAVRRALVRLPGGGWELRTTKTKRERRVPLAALAVKMLLAHQVRQEETRELLGTEYASHGFIFASGFGEPLVWNTIVPRHFHPIMARLALRMDGKPSEPPAPEKPTRAARRVAKEAYEVLVEASLTRTGLEALRPYDLRHSAATLLLAADEHPKVVADMLGHSKVTLTLDTYTHAVKGLTDRAARRLEGVIADAPLKAETGAGNGARTPANSVEDRRGDSPALLPPPRRKLLSEGKKQLEPQTALH
jgi:integrase